jgi:hypothetical protein
MAHWSGNVFKKMNNNAPIDPIFLSMSEEILDAVDKPRELIKSRNPREAALIYISIEDSIEQMISFDRSNEENVRQLIINSSLKLADYFSHEKPDEIYLQLAALLIMGICGRIERSIP